MMGLEWVERDRGWVKGKKANTEYLHMRIYKYPSTPSVEIDVRLQLPAKPRSARSFRMAEKNLIAYLRRLRDDLNAMDLGE